METEKENRTIRFTIRLTESEASQLQKKMDLLGITNTAAYLRAMALNGYILRIDLPEIREMLRLLGNMTNNLNQIARRLNQTDSLTPSERASLLVVLTSLDRQLGDLLEQNRDR